MKKLFSTLVISFLSLVMVMPAACAVTFDAGEYLNPSAPIPDDAYLAAGNAEIGVDVFGDLYITGGSVSITSTVEEDLVVAGGRVTILGDVLGDLRVFGGQVSLYGNVGDDVVIGGGEVSIGPDAVIGGSVIGGAGVFSVSGTVREDIRGGMGMLILNGVVDGDVIVTIEDSIVIDKSAKIGGNLKYTAFLEAEIPKGVVGGEILFNQFEREEVLGDMTTLILIYKVLSYAAALVFAILLVIFSPKALVKAAELTKENVLRAFGIGVLTMIIAVVGSIVLMMTVIGIPLAVVILASLVIIMYIAKIFAAVWLGSYMVEYQKARKKLSRLKVFGVIMLMLLAYYLIDFIPYVGWIITAVLFLIAVGSIVLMKKEYWKFLKGKGML